MGHPREIVTAENALNRQVYALYGLTEEQIEFIEREALTPDNVVTETR